jgi:dihydroxy-acid dehydratase
VGHVTPEAQTGGVLAILRNGDVITIDAVKNSLEVDLGDAEIKQRFAAWKAPAYKVTQGTLYKYIKNVSTASEGCVTDE